MSPVSTRSAISSLRLAAACSGESSLSSSGLRRLPGVFLKGAAQRKTADPSAAGEPGGVGRHEGERIVRVVLVLGQVQGDPADPRPLRGVGFQKGGQTAAFGGMIDGPADAAVPRCRAKLPGSDIPRPASAARSGPTPPERAGVGDSIGLLVGAMPSGTWQRARRNSAARSRQNTTERAADDGTPPAARATRPADSFSAKRPARPRSSDTPPPAHTGASTP